MKSFVPWNSNSNSTKPKWKQGVLTGLAHSSDSGDFCLELSWTTITSLWAAGSLWAAEKLPFNGNTKLQLPVFEQLDPSEQLSSLQLPLTSLWAAGSLWAAEPSLQIHSFSSSVVLITPDCISWLFDITPIRPRYTWSHLYMTLSDFHSALVLVVCGNQMDCFNPKF